MDILWIPHCPPKSGSVRRDQHLTRHLRPKHTVHTVRWNVRRDFTNPLNLLNSCRFYREVRGGESAFHVRRLPDLLRPLRGDSRASWWVNRFLFRRDIRRILDRVSVDVIVTAYTQFMTGTPPFDVDSPVIFDYLDCAERVDGAPSAVDYLRQADGVMGVSRLTVDRAREYNDSVVRIPNGVDEVRFREASGREVRERYGLEDVPVVSLIGLNERGRTYFLDAVRRVLKRRPEVHFLFVGESERTRRTLSERSLDGEKRIHFTGPVSYDEVPGYYAASDVGLFPAGCDDHSRGRSPIKVFEYTAARTPVVVPPLEEIQRLDFRNFVLAEPEAASFAEGILEALELGPTEEPRIRQHDWRFRASQVEEFLKSHLGRRS